MKTDFLVHPIPPLYDEASRILIDHLRYISGINEEIMPIVAEPITAQPHVSSEILDTPIENLDLSVRVFNSLKRTGVTSVGDVLDLLDKGDDAVKSIRNFGEKSLDELRAKLQEKGYLKKDKESE